MSGFQAQPKLPIKIWRRGKEIKASSEELVILVDFIIS